MLQGRYVDNSNDIMVSDVPIDGTKAIFVKNDGSEIYTRKWNSDGTVSSCVYRIDLGVNDTQMNNLPLNELEALFEAINKRIDRVEKTLDSMI